jgi:transposase-like protein
MPKELVCDECSFIFRVYAPKRRKGESPDKQFYCPNCGDNFAVREYTTTTRDAVKYTRIPWTKEELAALKRHVTKGIPCHQIALMLGRSHASIKNQVRRVKAAANGKKGQA